ncbi:hypothetical protein CBS147333_1270 [Penicillium roqueforti]|nr:hypothetical protein CBS147354_8151 [Penicillium roqueforti]KAI3115770.1 hypothetical protein CBS147333_1270 [Penicillium roqueforti]KAI3212735.1 hypothetical protein CBS147311_308 [Penicillium roqueforti]KAI3276837.1 hypothetical protein CBS147308_1474 [Penicillium roqueforti]KAI3294978.1 hypothetical protein DTO002I6_4350 [Penicillium roqueforti]
MAEEVDLSASRVTTVTICYSVPIPFMILFTGLRLFVVLRPSSKDPLSFDDYMITFSTAISIGLCISGLVYGPPYGFGRHQATLSTHEVQGFLRGDYIFSHFYDWAIVSIKLSILGLYYRIFSTVVFRRVIIGTAVFIFCWLAAMEIGLGLQCIPIERSWDSDVKGTCINLVAFSYFTNITNLVSDIWVFLLPLPIIFGLHVNRKRKLEIAGVFAIGLFTCGVTLARLTVVVSQGSSDFTWAGVPLGILSIYEVLCGIACANLPFLYKLAIGPFKKSASYHSRIGESESGAELHPIHFARPDFEFPQNAPILVRKSTGFFYHLNSRSDQSWDKPDFHLYTAGRWLFNETQQLAERRVNFNFDELVRVAMESLDFGPHVCTEVEKLPDGNYSKAFLLTTESGHQLVAKVPNPNAGPLLHNCE